MKKTIIIISEVGRIKGKTSVDIIVLENNLNTYRGDFNFSTSSNRGVESEAMAHLVEIGKIDKELVETGYFRRDNEDFTLILVEGRGLNYTTIF